MRSSGGILETRTPLKSSRMPLTNTENMPCGFSVISNSHTEHLLLRTPSKFANLISRLTPKSPEAYETRAEFSDIEPIEEADLPLLGYVSGRHLKDLDFSIEASKFLGDNIGSLSDALARFGPDNQARLSAIMGKYSAPFPASGTSGITSELLAEAAKNLESAAAPLRKRMQNAREIGLRNTHRYLTLPHLDVYVATSMRTADDFIAQHRFIASVFEDPPVKPLKLRFFDPTLSFVDDRITKGIIECLMLRRARVTIYNAGAEDTMGKDSELAGTLAQGKPVIVYVPTGTDKLDRRAEVFRVDHPLGLQIALITGVAHGIIVVRSAEQCARILRQVLLRTLEFTIRHEGGNYLLDENETHSVLRVVSDDALLTHAFWTYFHQTSTD